MSPSCCPMHPPRRPKRPFLGDKDGRVLPIYRFLARPVHPFWVHLCYFACLSLLGFLFLRLMPPRETARTSAVARQSPSNLDFFFMSVSAVTVSSMGVIEMEYFSNLQLLVVTVLMLMGGEVFVSMLALHLRRLELESLTGRQTAGEVVDSDEAGGQRFDHHIELGQQMTATWVGAADDGTTSRLSQILPSTETPRTDEESMRSTARMCLCSVVLGYLLIVKLVGSLLVLAYLNLVSAAGDVVRGKKIPLLTFSIFSGVSSFTNCGFIPTNEGMIIFRENSGLQLLIGAVILAGNTMYPPLMRAAIWAAGKWTGRAEYKYMAENHTEMGYGNLLSARRCGYLTATVACFVLVQAVAFCAMEWDSGSLEGMSWYQKAVAALFMAVNARHAGESVVDLAKVSPAVLVLYVVMIYLPPHTAFIPRRHDEDAEANNGGRDRRWEKERLGGRQRWAVLECLVLSQLSYIAVFTALICITERKHLSQDPLNFSVLNIVIEVVSAYGNVGFTTGYSCGRRLSTADAGDCTDMWYGFSGRWTDGGKLLLICVMFFGKLKNFGINKGGEAWILA